MHIALFLVFLTNVCGGGGGGRSVISQVKIKGVQVNFDYWGIVN